MTNKTLIEKLKIEKKKWENKIYGVGETRIDLMIDDVIKELQTQQEEIERLKKTELKTKGGGIKVTLEGLLDIEKKMLELEAEIEKKDKIIDEMAEQIYDEWYIPNIKTVNDVKEYFINKVEKENKDDN